MQANVEGRRNDGVEALTEHAVAVRANHIVAHPDALRTVDALVGIAQDEAVRQVHIVIMVIADLAIVETVIGQAMLDTVLLQIALPGGRVSQIGGDTDTACAGTTITERRACTQPAYRVGVLETGRVAGSDDKNTIVTYRLVS